jgi:hypothetical protein
VGPLLGSFSGNTASTSNADAYGVNAADFITIPPATIDSLNLDANPVLEDTAVTLSGTFSDPDGETVTVDVDWGDGTVETGISVTQAAGSGSFSITHAYQASGDYTITAKATDGNSGYSDRSVAIRVDGPGFVGSYDFNNLTAGDLNGQDGWVVTYNNWNGPLVLDSTQTLDSSLAPHSKVACPGCYSRAVRESGAGLSMPDFADTTKLHIYDFDFDGLHWGSSYYIGSDLDGDGKLGGMYFAHWTLSNMARLGGTIGGTLNGTLDYTEVSTDGLLTNQWQRMRLVMDTGVAGGKGCLLYKNPPSAADWAPIPGLQEVSLMLPADTSDEGHPANWNAVAAQFETDPDGGWDNLAFASIDRPSEIQFENLNPAENSPSGTLVGNVAVVPAPGRFTYALAAGSGDTDNASFTISGDQLKAAATLTAGLYSLRVRASSVDYGDCVSHEQVITLQIGDQDLDPATLGSDPLELGEGTLTLDGGGNSATIDNDINGGPQSQLALNGTGGMQELGGTVNVGTITATTGTLLITGNVTADNIMVAKGTLIVVAPGAQLNGNISVIGTLSGSGTINGSVTMEPGSVLAPGQSPGQLTINGDLTFAAYSEYQAELLGTVPGTGYDQVIVNGAIIINPLVQLDLVSDGNAPIGNEYRILDNDASDGIDGAFANAAEGADITVGAELFSKSYVGGTGNDGVVTRAAIVPGVPQNLAVTPVGLASWTAPASGDTPTGYNVYLDQALATDSPVTGLGYQFTGLTCDTSYSVMVTALNSGGESEGASVQLTTPACQQAQIIPQGTDSILVTLPTGTGADFFQIYRDDRLIATADADYLDIGLMPGISYSYEIFAVTGGIPSTVSVIAASATTISPVPGTPQNLDVTPAGLASWTAPASGGTPAGYNVYLDQAMATDSPVTGLDYQFTGLTCDTSYSVMVTAQNSGGESAGASAELTTSACQTVRITPQGADSMLITLPTGTGADSFQIYRDDKLIATVDAGNANYLDTGLTVGNDYSYEIFAVSNDVPGAVSAAASSATMELPTPATPVPTLSQWGLVLLSAIAGLLGFGARRGRKHQA